MDAEMAARHARLVQVEAQEAVSEEVADRAAQLGSHELAAPLPAASAGYFPILEIEFPLLAAQQAAKASVQVAGFPDGLAAQLAAQAAARLGLAPKLAAQGTPGSPYWRAPATPSRSPLPEQHGSSARLPDGMLRETPPERNLLASTNPVREGVQM